MCVLQVSSYLFSLAWGLLHVSGIGVEVPDSPRGVACILVVSLAAIATNATLIGSVTTTLTQINAYRAKEARHREEVTAFLTSSKAPPGLQKRIHEYYDFAGGVSRNHKTAMPGLPKSLHFQLESASALWLSIRRPASGSSRPIPATPPCSPCLACSPRARGSIETTHPAQSS